VLLSGRWHWAVLAALLLATAGAVLGWRSTVPTYRANGHIRVLPNDPDPDPNRESVMPMYDSFVNEMTSQFTSHRVVSLAMEDPRWQETDPGLGTEAIQRFRAGLNAYHPPRSQAIIVSYVDEDKQRATTAVRVLIDAFQVLYRKYNDRDRTRRDVLTKLEEDLTLKIAAKRREIEVISSQYGTEDLSDLYRGSLESMLSWRTQLESMEAELEAMGGEPEPSPDAGDAPGEDASALVQMIDPLDLERATRLLFEYQELAESQAIRQSRFGANHPESQRMEASTSAAFSHLALLARRSLAPADTDLVPLLDRVEGVQNALANAAASDAEPMELTALREDLQAARRDVIDHIRNLLAPAMVEPGVDNDLGPRPTTRAELAKRVERLRERYEAAKEETRRVGQMNLSLKRLASEEADLLRELGVTQDRLHQLDIRSQMGGIIDFEQVSINPPVGYASDNRKKRAILAGGAGGCAGFVLVLGWCAMDRRLRNSHQAKDSAGDAPLLGLLPRLDGEPTPPDAAHAMSMALHRVRTMLQIECHQDCPIIAVTGPSPASGKTSVTMGLGLSFASANCRTLVIDADTISGALTHRLGRPGLERLGEMIVDRGWMDEHGMARALEVASAGDRRLGDVLTEMGIVDDDRLKALLQEQSTGRLGLDDTINGHDAEEAIRPTEFDNLFLLPTVRTARDGASRVTPKAIARVFEHVRGKFDVVLVDLGPAPGSPESPGILSQADGAVIVVSRDDDRLMTRSSLGFVSGMGTRVLGVVFNRAEMSDVDRSPYSTHSTRMSQPPAADDSQNLDDAMVGAVRTFPRQ
jgi:Mrp family chromosome partitioning ATPase